MRVPLKAVLRELNRRGDVRFGETDSDILHKIGDLTVRYHTWTVNQEGNKFLNAFKDGMQNIENPVDRKELEADFQKAVTSFKQFSKAIHSLWRGVISSRGYHK